MDGVLRHRVPVLTQPIVCIADHLSDASIKRETSAAPLDQGSGTLPIEYEILLVVVKFVNLMDECVHRRIVKDYP